MGKIKWNIHIEMYAKVTTKNTVTKPSVNGKIGPIITIGHITIHAKKLSSISQERMMVSQQSSGTSFIGDIFEYSFNSLQ